MNESNIIRLYNYLKNNYIKLYDSPVRYHYICSTRNFHYFTQHSFDEFKIKAVHKENKNNVYTHKFSNCEELITLLRDKPFLETIFANIVKQLSYYLYLVQNRIKCSGTNVNDVFYIEARTYFNEYKNQYSDYLNNEGNTIISTPIRFSAQNIFIDDRDRVARIQINPENILTSNTMSEQRVREIVQQAFRERISELRDRMNITATDPRIEQNLRELRLRVEELSRRFDRRRNPEQR